MAAILYWQAAIAAMTQRGSFRTCAEHRWLSRRLERARAVLSLWVDGTAATILH